MHTFKKILPLFAIFMVTPIAFAEEDYDPFFELILMGGIGTIDADDATVQVTEVETDTLTQTNDDDWRSSWTGQIGLGYVYPLAEDFDTDDLQFFSVINPQLNVYYTGGDIDGDVLQFGDPDFNNMDYDMDFNSIRLMFDVALTVLQLQEFSLYAIGGLGIAWNNVDFNAEAEEDCECGAANYDTDSDWSTGLAYEFGGGISYALTTDVSLSLEYLYTGFNDVEIGDSDDDEAFENDLDIEGSKFDLNTQMVLLGLRVAL